MTREQNKTPDWLLERIALGELPADELAAARAQLESEPDGMQRLQALEQSNQDLLRDYPPRVVSAGIRERQRQQKIPTAARWSRRLALISPLAAAALLVLWLGLPSSPQHADPPEITRSKGLQTHLRVYLKSGADQARPLHADDAVAPGDTLQLAYQIVTDSPAGQTPAKRYGAIYSLDGRGAWTRHLPAASSAGIHDSVPLQTPGELPLSQAYQLDDAPAFECFYLVVSEAPLPLQALNVLLKQKITPRNARALHKAHWSLDSHAFDLTGLCLRKR